MRIGIIEDNERLAGILRAALENGGLPADVYPTAGSARAGMRQHDYALLVVDRGLGNVSFAMVLVSFMIATPRCGRLHRRHETIYVFGTRPRSNIRDAIGVPGRV